MVVLDPIASGLIEGTLLALLGVILFQLRHRAGLIPFIFLLGGLALTFPFTAQLTPLELSDPWTISRGFAVVLPVFVVLVLLLDAFIGGLEARITAGLGLLGGLLVAAASLASHLFPVVLPARLLPSATEALAAGAALALASFAAILLFELWHTRVSSLPPLAILSLSGLAAVLVHGVIHHGLTLAGLTLAGGTWPAIVAVPLISGLAPIGFVAVYAGVLFDDLAPMTAQVERATGTDNARDLDSVRRAEGRYRDALDWVQEASQALDARPAPAGVGLFVADPEGRLLDVNEPLAWMLGRPVDEIVGDPAGPLLFPLEHPDTATTPPSLARMPQGEHTSRIHRPDGGVRHLTITLTRTQTGAIQGRVEDRTIEKLRDEAHRHRDRARFVLHLLTRDLPNYLTAPVSRAEALIERTDPKDPADPEAIHRLACRLAQGLDDVERALDRVRPIADLDAPVRATVDLAPLLQDAVERLGHETLEDLRIRWKIPSGPIEAMGDALLVTAFEEILRNVHDHAGPDATATIGVSRRGDRWIVSIADDGPGVPTQLRDRIFRGFTQGSDGRGAGIGLYLARAITEGLGGRIEVEDRIPGRPGQGTAFLVTLPAADGGSWERPLDVFPGADPPGDEGPATA